MKSRSFAFPHFVSLKDAEDMIYYQESHRLRMKGFEGHVTENNYAFVRRILQEYEIKDVTDDEVKKIGDHIVFGLNVHDASKGELEHAGNLATLRKVDRNHINGSDANKAHDWINDLNLSDEPLEHTAIEWSMLHSNDGILEVTQLKRNKELTEVVLDSVKALDFHERYLNSKRSFQEKYPYKEYPRPMNKGSVWSQNQIDKPNPRFNNTMTPEGLKSWTQVKKIGLILESDSEPTAISYQKFGKMMKGYHPNEYMSWRIANRDIPYAQISRQWAQKRNFTEVIPKSLARHYPKEGLTPHLNRRKFVSLVLNDIQNEVHRLKGADLAKKAVKAKVKSEVAENSLGELIRIIASGARLKDGAKLLGDFVEKTPVVNIVGNLGEVALSFATTDGDAEKKWNKVIDTASEMTFTSSRYSMADDFSLNSDFLDIAAKTFLSNEYKSQKQILLMKRKCELDPACQNAWQLTINPRNPTKKEDHYLSWLRSELNQLNPLERAQLLCKDSSVTNLLGYQCPKLITCSPKLGFVDITFEGKQQLDSSTISKQDANNEILAQAKVSDGKLDVFRMAFASGTFSNKYSLSSVEKYQANSQGDAPVLIYRSVKEDLGSRLNVYRSSTAERDKIRLRKKLNNPNSIAKNCLPDLECKNLYHQAAQYWRWCQGQFAHSQENISVIPSLQISNENKEALELFLEKLNKEYNPKDPAKKIRSKGKFKFLLDIQKHEPAMS